MKDLSSKILKEITDSLIEIKVSDFMNLYTAIWSVIILGGALVLLGQGHIIAGIVLILLSPIPIIILSVISKIIFSHLIKGLDGKEEQPEITFPRTFYHRELHLLGTTVDQVITYIKNSISTTLWYFNKDDKVAYFTDYERTKFYDPQKDNTNVHGIIFAGLKYDLELIEETGLLKKKNEEKIPNMFNISIVTIGTGDNAKLLINFETQTPDASIFFDEWVKKLLNKEFTVEEKDIPSFYMRPHHAEFTISNADALTVAKALHDDLTEIPHEYKNGNITLMTNGGVYYPPDDKDNFHPAFVVHGIKKTEIHGHYWIGEMRSSADPKQDQISEMFFIRVIQCGGNTTQIKFDTDYRDVFQLFGGMVLYMLKDKFSFTTTVGFENISADVYNDHIFLAKEKFGITLRNLTNNDFTDIEIELKEARHVILDENKKIKRTNSIKSTPNQNVFKGWKSINPPILEKLGGHETIFLGKKDNNDVALLLDSNISFHIEDGDYISSPPVDVAKTYIDLIVEVRGKLGQDSKSMVYKVNVEYISNKMYTDSSDKNISKIITYIAVESVEPYEEQK